MSFARGGRLFDAAVVDSLGAADDEHMSVHRLPVNLRDRVAARIRDDVIHGSAMSQCDRSVDECPDWPLAYVMTDLILPVIADQVSSLIAPPLPPDSPLTVMKLERWNAAINEVLALLSER